MKDNDSSPLFERIMVIGLCVEDVEKLFATSNNLKQGLSQVKNLRVEILEEYKSTDLRESSNDNYVDNITMVN